MKIIIASAIGSLVAITVYKIECKIENYIKSENAKKTKLNEIVKPVNNTKPKFVHGPIPHRPEGSFFPH